MASITRRELIAKAKSLGVKYAHSKRKHDLITSIQIAEGNSPCFQTIHNCGELHCLFHEDCQKAFT